MTSDDNLADLVRHRAEFEARDAFAYSLLDDDEVIGCLYIDPVKDRPGEAQVVSWVRASRAEMDRTVWGSISAWLAADWPFTGFTYAARA
jgi:hypothetical protein